VVALPPVEKDCENILYWDVVLGAIETPLFELFPPFDPAVVAPTPPIPGLMYIISGNTVAGIKTRATAPLAPPPPPIVLALFAGLAPPLPAPIEKKYTHEHPAGFIHDCQPVAKPPGCA
jgi:hypothetical protein